MIMCSSRRIAACAWSSLSWILLSQVTLGSDQIDVTRLAASAGEVTLYLDLKVNGVPAGSVVPVRVSGDELYVRRSDLQIAGMTVPAAMAAQGEWLPLTQPSDLQYHYDSNALLLEITVPPHWLAEQHLGNRQREMMPATSSAGLVLNYGAHAIGGDERATFGSLWSEWRLFGAAGVLTHTGVHRYVDAEDGWSTTGVRQRGYIRFDTAWSNSNEAQLHRWTVGDLITSSQSWSTPVRIAGLQLSRDFRLRPDLITYPLPQFSGQTAVPSTLDLFIDGQRVLSEQVRPGPYTISSMPIVTGSGEAILVTTDILGRQVVTTIPFYASSELLRAGLSDYAVSFGALRRDYGVENFSYGRFASAGSLRLGVTDTFTLEGQMELASTREGSFGLVGLGAVMKAGMLGIVNGAITRSGRAEERGWQYSFGYRYANRGFTFAYQGTRTSPGFYSLAEADTAQVTHRADRDIATLGLSSARLGSVALSYVRLEPLYHERSEFLTFSYSKHLADAVSLRIGATRDLQRDEGMFTVQLLASLGRGGSVTLGTQQGEDSRDHFQYVRGVPPSGGIGWNVAHARSDGDRSYTDASLAWGGRYARAELGVSDGAAGTTEWANLLGSVLFMGNDMFVARQVSDAFVVVSTGDIGDVPVRYENQLVGRTDRRGRLLIPAVTSHYAARFSVDPTDLPPDVSIQDTDRRLVVKRRSGVKLDFEMRRTRVALMQLVHAGGVVPVGSEVTEVRTKQHAIVGYDGLVYFEDLEPDVELQVRMPDGSACHVDSMQLREAQGGQVQLPLLCESRP
jgi:outer membrane usher protein